MRQCVSGDFRFAHTAADAHALQVVVLDGRVVGVNSYVVHADFGYLDGDIVVSYVAARYRAQTQCGIAKGFRRDGQLFAFDGDIGDDDPGDIGD